MNKRKLAVINKTLEVLLVVFLIFSGIFYLGYVRTSEQMFLYSTAILPFAAILLAGFRMTMFLTGRGWSLILHFWNNIGIIILAGVFFVFVCLNKMTHFELTDITAALGFYSLIFVFVYKYYNRKISKKDLERSIITRREWLYCQACGEKIYRGLPVIMIGGNFFHRYEPCMRYGEHNNPDALGSENLSYKEAEERALGKDRRRYSYKKLSR